jgi:hypothetical protein
VNHVIEEKAFHNIKEYSEEITRGYLRTLYLLVKSGKLDNKAYLFRTLSLLYRNDNKSYKLSLGGKVSGFMSKAESWFHDITGKPKRPRASNNNNAGTSAITQQSPTSINLAPCPVPTVKENEGTVDGADDSTTALLEEDETMTQVSMKLDLGDSSDDDSIRAVSNAMEANTEQERKKRRRTYYQWSSSSFDVHTFDNNEKELLQEFGIHVY